MDNNVLAILTEEELDEFMILKGKEEAIDRLISNLTEELSQINKKRSKLFDQLAIKHKFNASCKYHIVTATREIKEGWV